MYTPVKKKPAVQPACEGAIVAAWGSLRAVRALPPQCPPSLSGHALLVGHLKSLVFHLRLRALPMPKASAPAPTPTPDATEPVSYEAALQELEQLVARIESGQLPLDQMLAGYQRGAQLLAFCRSRLEAVQDQIKVLDDGVLQPWSQE